MLSELALFVLVLALNIVMIASIVNALEHNDANFNSIVQGSRSFSMLSLSMALGGAQALAEFSC